MVILTATVLVSILWFNTVSAIPTYYMDEECGGTLNLSYTESTRLKLTSERLYQPYWNCTLLVTSKHNDRIMLYFKEFDIGCDTDWLDVHDGKSVQYPYVRGLTGNLCGTSMSSTVRTTTGFNLFLHFKSGSAQQRKGFDMVITRFHTGACNAREFSCGNGRCISDKLICNGYNPCGDDSDCVLVLAAGIIVAITLGSLCFCLAMTCCFVICIRRRRRRFNRGIYQPVVVTTSTSYGTGYN